MKIDWFKDKDGSLWFHDFEGQAIYVIFDTKLKKEGWFVGIYRNVRIERDSRGLVWERPLFYDGFKLNKAKELVGNMVGVKDGKKDKRVR